MQFTFLSAHSIQGIIHNPETPDLVLYDDPRAGLRVTMTGDPNRHLHLVNRQLALASMMFRAMITEPLDEAFPRNLEREIARINQQRLDAAGTDGVVAIQIIGEIDVAIPENVRTVEDFQLCFDAFDKKALRSCLLPQVSSILTALRLNDNEPYEFRFLADGSFLTTPEGMIVHSFTMETGQPGLYLSSPLNDAQREGIARDIPLIIRADNLERIVRLYAYSLDRATDNYRSFIAAWSALEILIGKIFPTYQRLLAADLRQVNQPPGLHAYFDRVDEVMADKHSLAAKFLVIAMYLDDARLPTADEAIFRRLKRVRDGLFHGEEISEEGLPTREVQQLFDKYFRNHVRRNSAN